MRTATKLQTGESKFRKAGGESHFIIMSQYKRRQKLPKRKLQLKLIFAFVGIAAFGLLLQFILFLAALSSLAPELPQDGALLMENASGTLLFVLAVSCLVVLPLTFIIGVITTFRFAGPVFRFERFLEAVARGTQVEDCKLRKGDELLELCQLINEATAPLRKPGKASVGNPLPQSGPAAPLPAVAQVWQTAVMDREDKKL